VRPGATSTRRRRRLLKLGLGIAAFVPAAVTAVRFFTGKLGANPIAEALNTLGLWTLILLLTTLACTPVKIVTGWTWPLALRRMLGLCAFAYASLHLCMYLVVDQFFAWDEIWKDIVKRKFITVGVLAFLLLVPLAVTSTSKMVKRLGFARWKRLHRLAYVVAVLGVVHFTWRVKADTRGPFLCGAVLALLLALRLLPLLRSRRAAAAR
jgi:methionine sulfoxide reductase heme-binding subunit